MMTKVSFIIVAYNAEKCLGALLDDLLAQTLAPRQLEVLLVDSASSDGTRQMMCDFSKRAPFSVKVLDNPKRWLASGINIALQAATGDAVIRLDAHARIPKDFLEKNVRALENGEDIVGGSVCGAEPESDWEAVTRALDTSRFCGGAAPFRNGGEARYVDTLAYALYRREVYDRVGLYDERLRRTEDNDMHYRMRKAGYRFYFSPDILSWHGGAQDAPRSAQSKMGQRLLDWPHDAHPAPLLCPPSSDSCAVCAGSHRPAGGFSAVGASALRDAPAVRAFWISCSP